MPRCDEEGDGLGHRLAALQLHRRRAGLLEDPRGVAERLLGALLIGAERHVDGDQSVPRAAHHRGAVRAHHLEADRNGRGQAVNDLAEAVADQQQVAMRIEQLRHPHRVGGERDDRLAALAGQDRRRGQPLHRRRRRRGAAGRRVDRVGGHGPRLADCCGAAKRRRLHLPDEASNRRPGGDPLRRSPSPKSPPPRPPRARRGHGPASRCRSRRPAAARRPRGAWRASPQ